MAQLVVMGAMLRCTFGLAPSSLVVVPSAMVNGSTMAAATIMDHKPMANIMPFDPLDLDAGVDPDEQALPSGAGDTQHVRLVLGAATQGKAAGPTVD